MTVSVRGAAMRPQELTNRVRTDPKLSAEVELYDALRLQLGPDWIVFYSVRWQAPSNRGGMRDGETDFILAHPTKGILLVEVKGGRIRFEADQRQWFSRDRHDVDHPIDPFVQAANNKYALRDRLKTLRTLQDIRQHDLPLAHAVAFPHVARPTTAVTPDAGPEIIIGQDDLVRLRGRVDEILAWSLGARRPDHSTGSRIVRELTAMLGQTTEFRNPLLASVAADEHQHMIRLTEEQFRLLDWITQHRRAAIGGCAGAGKTFMAVEKARRLAGQDFRTLLTCYNTLLADHLKQITKGTPNLDVMTFHDFCGQVIKAAGLRVPVDPDEQPDMLDAAIMAVPDLRYDAILVDEGQDFDADWWIALEACLREPEHGILYVFHDTHQSLYRGRGTLPSNLLPLPLHENIRNTRAICRYVERHYTGDSQIASRGPVGRTVETLMYETPQDLGKMLGRTLHRLLTVEGFSARDIVVLTPRSLEQSALPTLRLPGAVSLTTEEARVGQQRVLCATIPGFKGLERPVVIVAEVDQQLVDDDQRESLCYVAFSRARSYLIVLGQVDALAVVAPPAR